MGQFSDPEPAEYKGMWFAGKRQGKGEMSWADGSTFEGIWTADQRVFGIMKMTNGYVYVGNFKRDLMEGYCRIYMSEGEVFLGEFKEGKA